MLSHKDMTQLKNILEYHGPTVTKLELIVASSFGIGESEFIEMLNFMPKLTELKMVIWEKSLRLECGNQKTLLHLFNLRRLEFFGCTTTVLKIFTASLPRHVISEFKFSGKQNLYHVWDKFVTTQLSIKRLDISGDFNDNQPFQKLQLTHFRVVFRDEYSLLFQNFIKSFIKSQTGLIHFDALCLTHGRCMKINSDSLIDISSLTKLQSLLLNIEEISSWKIQTMTTLRKLKTLEIDSNCENSIGTIVKLSLINNFEVENFVFRMNSLEVPTCAYKNIGRNFLNLKSLTIAYDAKHKINFFMKQFPNLESLKVKYGDSKKIVYLVDVYDDDGVVHAKMKHLTLIFNQLKPIKVDLFFRMRNCFPNLEKLEVHAKFPFCSRFMYELLGCIRKIKSLTIASFSVRNKEKFDHIMKEVLIHMRKKLKYIKIIFRNLQNLSRHSVPISGDSRIESCDERDPKFSYIPIINELQGYFNVRTSKSGDNKLARHLEISAGRE